jgi:hypothetical protein
VDYEQGVRLEVSLELAPDSPVDYGQVVQLEVSLELVPVLEPEVSLVLLLVLLLQ